MPNIRAILLAASIAVAPSAAKADLIGDLIRSLQWNEARLHPSNSGLKRTRTPPMWSFASYYGGGERLNRHTANGERFNPGALTAAHRSLPFGTKVLVSHGDRSVVVRVNDRGPAAYTGRSIDLSRAAAARLAMLGAGVARVTIQVLR
ncbi:septal ring lytic transglycosylase RlpA family protein [Methylosinus sp. PW1]|uniref:septal ring lytic transglycosylase RlpA family protein n=1 Tax=Methylosinus sp. PW1 TaxID=107636 RepID=UPI00068BF1AC|nr:septal ring lytic transglycosylase RlpA family protein [Methylosinus sp. PW1]